MLSIFEMLEMLPPSLVSFLRSAEKFRRLTAES